VRGASNKEAARTLGISPRTVEFHRANVMQKLGAKNTADLVRRLLGE
jgi:two-component system response regulator FixJ